MKFPGNNLNEIAPMQQVRKLSTEIDDLQEMLIAELRNCSRNKVQVPQVATQYWLTELENEETLSMSDSDAAYPSLLVISEIKKRDALEALIAILKNENSKCKPYSVLNYGDHNLVNLGWLGWRSIFLPLLSRKEKGVLYSDPRNFSRSRKSTYYRILLRLLFPQFPVYGLFSWRMKVSAFFWGAKNRIVKRPSNDTPPNPILFTRRSNNFFIIFFGRVLFPCGEMKNRP